MNVALMLDDYRSWLESELALLGNASHHAYAFGQANMAKRALEKLDEFIAKAPRITFIEAPSNAIAADTAFYERAFGWQLTPFGPTYACTMSGLIDIGLQADAAEATAAALLVIEVPDLEAAEEAVTRAGGTITRPIFAFPGGRRFHFQDPSRNELAAFKPDPT